jgi:hypothetical protein
MNKKIIIGLLFFILIITIGGYSIYTMGKISESIDEKKIEIPCLRDKNLFNKGIIIEEKGMKCYEIQKIYPKKHLIYFIIYLGCVWALLIPLTLYLKKI